MYLNGTVSSKRRRTVRLFETNISCTFQVNPLPFGILFGLSDASSLILCTFEVRFSLFVYHKGAFSHKNVYLNGTTLCRLYAYFDEK